jgi:outer membrane protein assembly factor BamE (lipoprotein component of BamABCDE complex)
MSLNSPRSIGLALLLSGALAACSPTIQIHGYVPPETDVGRIRPGFDDTGSVEKLLGRPSSSGVLADSAWYYVQSTVENYTYHAPKVIDRKVLAVNFDQRGVVRDVRRYGLDDGRIIALDPETTATGGREMGVLEQLFGNILNLDAETLNSASGY